MTWTTISIFGLPFLIGIVSASNNPRIVGGDDAKIQFFPYQVSLRALGDMHFCGGAIISDRHILTAAHCMHGTAKDLVSVHSGTNKSNKLGNVHAILAVNMHPKWNGDEKKGYPNDIAVITLKDPISFDKYQNQVNLPTHDIHDSQAAHLTGWGRTTNLNKNVPKNLHKIRVELMTSDKCKPLLTHKISNKQFCSFDSSEIGPCFGDNGGPLVSKGELVGIVSVILETDTCPANHPILYTNVFAYKNFIETIIYQ